MYLDEKVSVWFNACPTAHARILWDEFITLYLHFRIHITVIFHIKIWWYYKYKATICIQEDGYKRIEDLQRILLIFIRMPSIFIKHLKKHVTNTTKNFIQSLRSGAMNTSIFLIEVCWSFLSSRLKHNQKVLSLSLSLSLSLQLYWRLCFTCNVLSLLEHFSCISFWIKISFI